MVLIRQQLIPDTSMKFGRANPKQFLTIHETGNTSPGANAAAHANLQSRMWDWATWHWTVDALEAVQSYGHEFQLWHAGDGYGNGNLASIAIEICVNSDMDRAKARQNAADLAAHILMSENIPLANMVQHNHWSGKNCPSFIRGENRWQEFVSMVRASMGGTPAPSSPPARPARRTVSELAAAVYRGEWGNDPQRTQRLIDAGYDAAAVQAEVNRKYYGGNSAPTPPPAARKTVAQLAEEVWNGHWGNDPHRSDSLRALGYDPAAVQAEVNRRYYGAASPDVESLANAVLAGEYGNGEERRQRLGANYAAVQHRVNQKLGLV